MVTELERSPSFAAPLTLPEQARAVVIVDQASYDDAGNMKIHCATWRKRIVEEFAPMKKAAHDAHKLITTKEGEYLAPVTEAESIYVGKLRAWAVEQEKVRLAEQQRLAREALDREAADRKRREAEAAVARAEAERIQAEARLAEEAERLEKALALEAVGAPKEVIEYVLSLPLLEFAPVAPITDYMEPAAYVSPPVAAQTYERMKGLNIPRTWGADLFDIKSLCRAVGAGEVPETYVAGNMVALNGRARSDKSAMRIPGVRAVEK